MTTKLKASKRISTLPLRPEVDFPICPFCQCKSHDPPQIIFNRLMATYRLEETVGRRTDKKCRNSPAVTLRISTGLSSLQPFTPLPLREGNSFRKKFDCLRKGLFGTRNKRFSTFEQKRKKTLSPIQTRWSWEVGPSTIYLQSNKVVVEKKGVIALYHFLGATGERACTIAMAHYANVVLAD